MLARSRAREVALQLLYQYDFSPRLPREAIERFAHERLHRPELASFTLSLYDGALAQRADIDRRLKAVLENWRLHRLAAVDRNILRLGAYELLHRPETPPLVAINEAIELARRYGSADSPAFVNGVLDRLHQTAVSSST